MRWPASLLDLQLFRLTPTHVVGNNQTHRYSQEHTCKCLEELLCVYATDVNIGMYCFGRCRHCFESKCSHIYAMSRTKKILTLAMNERNLGISTIFAEKYWSRQVYDLVLVVSAAGTACTWLPYRPLDWVSFSDSLPVAQIVKHYSTPAFWDDVCASEMWNRLLKSGEHILFSLIASKSISRS